MVAPHCTLQLLVGMCSAWSWYVELQALFTPWTSHSPTKTQLLQHGANINHINNKLEGGTALHEAVANQQMPVASLLVQRGCMPTLENIKGWWAGVANNAWQYTCSPTQVCHTRGSLQV